MRCIIVITTVLASALAQVILHLRNAVLDTVIVTCLSVFFVVSLQTTSAFVSRSRYANTQFHSFFCSYPPRIPSA